MQWWPALLALFWSSKNTYAIVFSLDLVVPAKLFWDVVILCHIITCRLTSSVLLSLKADHWIKQFFGCSGFLPTARSLILRYFSWFYFCYFITSLITSWNYLLLDCNQNQTLHILHTGTSINEQIFVFLHYHITSNVVDCNGSMTADCHKLITHKLCTN